MTKKILDNSNLNESYSGITTPLTFSFAKRIYSYVYYDFCSFLGVSKIKLKNNSSILENMLEFQGGHMYYNLTNWHTMVSWLPFYKLNSKFMEEMMGIPAKSKGEIEITNNKFKFISFFSSFYILIRIFFIFLTMKFWFFVFSRRFNKDYKMLRTNLNNANSINKLIELYIKAEKIMASNFKIPIANDFAVMVSNGILKDKFHLQILPEFIKSAEPGKSLECILDLINSKKKYRNLFKHDINIIEKKLKHKDFKELNSLINNHVENYGARVPGELKLESITFQNDSSFFISFLKKLSEKYSKRKTVKISVEKTNNFFLGFLKKWVKQSIRIREDTRFKRTLVFSLARDLFLKLQDTFIESGLLKNSGDIFYLTVDEIEKYRKINLKEIVAKRRKLETRYKNLEMPHRLTIGNNFNLAKYARKKKNKIVSKKNLRGRVASLGGGGDVYTGESLVLTEFNYEADYNNKILVTKQTDPGWTIVFPLLKGLVVERGGLLSHAAIVAREYGIPCIIGVEKATSYVPNNSKVKLNVKQETISW